MKNDRSDWTVRKVTFAEAEKLDDEYYASLSELERLELLMNLRSMVKPLSSDIERVVTKRHIGDEEEI